MRRYARKCRGSGEAAAVETAAAAAGKKRKTALGESELSTSSVQQKTRRLDVATPENSVSPASSGNSTCESVSSGDCVSASCCSSSRSVELIKETSKSVDLEQENEAAVGFCATSVGDSVDFSDRREKTPPSEFIVESGELESTARPHQLSFRRRASTAAKKPTDAELEDFFAAAEKNLQRQFIDKYNYDIVKDEPLEGRYEWSQFH